MAADMYPGEGGFVEAKGTDIWTDVIIVGGSVPHDTGGNVQYIYGSGTNQTAKFGTATIATGVITTGSITSERTGQMIVVGSITSRSLGVPMIGAGSPVAAANYLIQCGQSGTDAGSKQWIGFNEKFSSTTGLRVVLQPIGTAGSGWISQGSISAGSYLAYTQHASTDFDWIAVGQRA